MACLLADAGANRHRLVIPQRGCTPAKFSSKLRTSSITLKAGTRLIREWNGIVHQVDVVEGGFVWNDRTMNSLSAVARAITGANWSGPRFFGL
jgi:hypothetical protein